MLMFRDETDDVARKFKDTEPSAVSIDGTADRASMVDSWTSATYQDSRDELPLFTVSNPLEEQALSFFFNKFVKASSTSRRGYLDFLPAMYDNAKPNDPLKIVLASVAMAFLSNTLVAPEMMVAARVKYTLALHSINIALQDPSEAITNQTCMAIILFGLYEVINNVATEVSIC